MTNHDKIRKNGNMLAMFIEIMKQIDENKQKQVIAVGFHW